MGHTLVDATTPSASFLIINPNAEEVVLPCGSHIGDLVPVLSVSVARSDLQLPVKMTTALPDYLEDIIRGSHASLVDTGRQSLRDLLHRYEHVFPAPAGRNRSNMRLKPMRLDRYVVDHADWHRPVSEGNRTVSERC